MLSQFVVIPPWNKYPEDVLSYVRPRRDRRAYISHKDQTMILFALMEPEERDEHTIFVDGLLMSPGSESYKLPPPVEFEDELRRFRDSQMPAPRITLGRWTHSLGCWAGTLLRSGWGMTRHPGTGAAQQPGGCWW